MKSGFIETVMKLLSLALFLGVMACDGPSVVGKGDGEAQAASGRVEMIVVQEDLGDVRERVRREQQRAEAQGLRLVIYVGAPWCEPCVRFHEAASRGELDSRFPKLRLLEFDHDKHEELLAKANCRSELIPLFALPAADGSCSDKRMEGGIKGEGAVKHLVPRLERLLQR